MLPIGFAFHAGLPKLQRISPSQFLKLKLISTIWLMYICYFMGLSWASMSHLRTTEFALNTFKYYIHNPCFGFYYPLHCWAKFQHLGLTLALFGNLFLSRIKFSRTCLVGGKNLKGNHFSCLFFRDGKLNISFSCLVILGK